MRTMPGRPMVHTVPPPYGGLKATCGTVIDGLRHTGWIRVRLSQEDREQGYTECPVCALAASS